MADKPKPPGTPASSKPAATPAEPPKPVHIGGESLVDRILPHFKKIIIGIVGAMAVLSVIFSVRCVQERRDVASTERLDRVLDVAQEPIRPSTAQPEPNQPGHASVKDRAAAVLAALAKEDTEVDHSFRGGLLLDAGNTDEAIAEYRKGVANRTVEGVLCREGLGLALETKATAEKDPAARQKGLEEALAAFAAMQPDAAGPRHAYALYHQARIQLVLGKRDEAKQLFEKAKEANKETDREIADLIEKRLAALGAS